jgi:hypothetical protein
MKIYCIHPPPPKEIPTKKLTVQYTNMHLILLGTLLKATTENITLLKLAYFLPYCKTN